MKLNLIDIDAVLDLQHRIEIFKKSDPTEIIHVVPSVKMDLVKNQWKSLGNAIYYNGETIWLSDKIKKTINLPLDILGYRITTRAGNPITDGWIDFLDDDPTYLVYEEEQNFDINNKELRKAQELLKQENVNLLKSVRLEADQQKNQHLSKFILECAIGREIQSLQFIDIETTKYDQINVFTKSRQKIDYLQSLDRLFGLILSSTDQTLKKKISSEVRHSQKIIKLYLVDTLFEHEKPNRIINLEVGINESRMEKFHEFISKRSSQF